LWPLVSDRRPTRSDGSTGRQPPHRTPPTFSPGLTRRSAQRYVPFLPDAFVKVDVAMIEILAIAMVSVYGVAVVGAFIASQILSFQITRYFKFRY
jgi:hypothetical protein